VVALPPCRLPAVALRNDHAPAVRVEQDLGGIEPKTTLGGRRPFDPVAVDLSRAQTWHEDMPVVVRTVRCRIEPDYAGGVGVLLPVEEQQLDARGSPREQAEVHAAVNDGSAKRRASADELRHDWLERLIHWSGAPRFTPEDE